MSWIARITFMLLMALHGAVHAANGMTPDATVQATIDDILGVMKTTLDKRELRRQAEIKVLPKFDFRGMTKLAVGRPWRYATPAQQDALESGFRSILVNTYTAALNNTDLKAIGIPTVTVRPVSAADSQDDVVVKTVVKWANRKPVQVDYRMTNLPDGWKINDVVVEGLSLVITYRGTFSEIVGQSGIPGLLKSIEEKNRAIAGS
jgi:phospholipid transport system substrate-binding protein